MTPPLTHVQKYWQERQYRQLSVLFLALQSMAAGPPGPATSLPQPPETVVGPGTGRATIPSPWERESSVQETPPRPLTMARMILSISFIL
jgi:hypothetical protein